MAKPKFYDCEICGHIHPWDWDDDCRDDENRFTCEELETRYGTDGFDLASMDERVEADSAP